MRLALLVLLSSSCVFVWEGGGGGSGGGGGGQGGSCSTASDCPAPVACWDASCEKGACVALPSPFGTPCPAKGLCDGLGTCETCSDGVVGSRETGVDCGTVGVDELALPACPPCPQGQGCDDPSDCQSGVCSTALAAPVCAAPTCSDLVQNGDETGIDCGGACPSDCASAS